MINQIKKYIKSFYEEFVLLNDTPHRIAFGFGIGVLLGILPFTGVIAAVAVAWYFKLNKPAAVLGSMITNTWLGFVVLGMSIHLSCIVLGVKFSHIQEKFEALLKNFQWDTLKDPYILKIVTAVIVGYFILSVVLSVLSYFVCLSIIYFKKPR